MLKVSLLSEVLVFLHSCYDYSSLLHSFEAPVTTYKRLKKLISFNNTTLNKRNVKALASWMFKILSPFDFQKVVFGKTPKILSQCLYGCIRYCWVGIKQFNIIDIANNQKFTKLLTTWMFKESFSFLELVSLMVLTWINLLTWSNLELIYIYQSNVCLYLSSLLKLS